VAGKRLKCQAWIEYRPIPGVPESGVQAAHQAIAHPFKTHPWVRGK